jgi:hypothetical protein
MASPPPDATRAKVRYRLVDTDADNPALVDFTTLDAAIVNALGRYSQDRPRIVTEDETGAGSGYFVLVGTGAVLASWIDGFSDVLAIEYPAAAVSATHAPTFLSRQDDWTFYRDATKTYLRLLSATPSASETVRITYSTPHSHDTASDTVPTADVEALCDLAAHYACLALATQKAGSTDSSFAADSVNYRDSQLRYKQQAEAWLASYERRMGQGEASGVGGASATGDWDQRYQASGWHFLTHSPRRR